MSSRIEILLVDDQNRNNIGAELWLGKNLLAEIFDDGEPRIVLHCSGRTEGWNLQLREFLDTIHTATERLKVGS